MRVALMYVVALGGCIEDGLVVCGDLACPVGYVCTAEGCATPAQLDACADLEDNATCAADFGNGACSGGVCFPLACGDGRIVGTEVCDDSNQLSGDGCSADCLSTETCGNDYVDPLAGEECDGAIRGLAGDGCTSLCSREFGVWRTVTPVDPPGANHRVATYDEKRERVVMYGGTDGTRTISDTWEWDGASWRRYRSEHAPTPGTYHAIAYDVLHERTILFDCQQRETWEWDGVDWLQRTTTTVPMTGFSSCTMAYDRARQEVMLATDALVWAWNGTDWITRPYIPALQRMTMAWDETRQRMVVGGSTLTYEWDGVSWTQGPNGSLVSRSYGELVSGPNGKVILYGGSSSDTPLQDMYEWSATGWTLVAPSPNDAGAQSLHAMAYDRSRQRVVLVGSATTPGVWELYNGGWRTAAGTYPDHHPGTRLVYQPWNGRTLMIGGLGSNDTWEWDGAGWEKRPVLATQPMFPWEYAAVATRDHVLLYAGVEGLALTENTWKLQDDVWTLVPTATVPQARHRHAMAYDHARDRVVMFGGYGAGPILDDTWEWDGVDWTEKMPAHHPSPRFFAAMAYDPIRQRTLLFGGYNGNDGPDAIFGDTWEWDGVDWTELHPATSPSPRERGNAMFDPRRGRIVMWGGSVLDATSELWEWDGTNWHRVLPILPPMFGTDTATTYDTARGEIVSFDVYGGTITFRYDSQVSRRDRCIETDTDGDMLAGCDDPDCAGRCAPLCVVGQPCDSALPHCGDGTCTDVENHRVCAADCD